MSETQKVLKLPSKFKCPHCDYKTSDKSNYNKHIRTKKHTDPQFETNVKHKKIPSTNQNCEHCNMHFKSRTTLWRHKKKCEILMILKENEDLKKENKSLVNKMMKDTKQSNTFNIKIFLNNDCKNAMNMGEFVKTLKPTMEDLDYSIKNGKFEGVSNILIKGLSDLDEIERPIHCENESKILYIKDNDNWEEDADNKIIEASIDDIESSHYKLIQEWENDNPDWMNNNELQTKYLDIVKSSMPKLTDNEKKSIIKRVSDIFRIKNNNIK